MPRVFISYSDDSDAHRDRVLALADRLRGDGIESLLDQYVVHPSEGWPSWTQQQIVDADFTILVCTPTYNRRFEGKESPGIGTGTTWEAWLIKQNLYEASGRNHKMIPVVFDDAESGAVPLVLRPFTRYRVPSGYDELLRHLTGQPKSPAPPVGPPRTMPSEARPRSPQAPGPRSGARPRWTGFAAAVVSVGGLGAVLWWAWPSTTNPEPAPSPPTATADPVISTKASHDRSTDSTLPATTTGSTSTGDAPTEAPIGGRRSFERKAPKPKPGDSTPPIKIDPPPPPPDPDPDPTPTADPRRWKVLDVVSNPDRFAGKRFRLDAPAPKKAILTLATRCDPPTTSTAGERCLVREDPDDPGGHYCFTRDSIPVGSTLCIHPQGTKAESR
jgi:hypothetical protein